MLFSLRVISFQASKAMYRSAFLPPLVITSKFRSHHVTYHRRIIMSSSKTACTEDSKKAVLRPKIAVVGGGHAGISTVLRLATLPWTRLTRPQITLIDKSDRFVFLPMLYELALSQVAQWEIAPKFSELLQGTNIKFIQGTVKNLDISSHAIEGTERTSSDEESEFRVLYDRAILSIGGETSNLDSIPGAEEHALPFHRMSDALALKARLASLRNITPPGKVINIVVVGGGYSGIELASCLADDLSTRASILLIETSDRILSRGPSFNRRSSLDALAANGVSVLYNSRVASVSAEEVTVTTKSKGDSQEDSKFPADVVLWTAGSRPASVQRYFDIPLDEAGRVETNSFLQIRGYEDRLYALGDAATTPGGGGYAGTAQVAVQEAEYAAWNAWASIMGKPKLPYKYTHLGEMMVLGEANATVSSPIGLDLRGKPAWIARRLAYLARMPTDKHRRRVAASWAAHPLFEGIGNLIRASRQYKTNV